MAEILSMNHFVGASQGEEANMLGKFLYFSLANLLVERRPCPICAKVWEFHIPAGQESLYRTRSAPPRVTLRSASR